MTALLAVVLAVILLRAVPHLWGVLGGAGGFASLLAVATGHGPQIFALLVITAMIVGLATATAVLALHRVVIVTVPRWAARAGGAA